MTAVTGLAKQVPRRLAISGHDRRYVKKKYRKRRVCANNKSGIFSLLSSIFCMFFAANQ